MVYTFPSLWAPSVPHVFLQISPVQVPTSLSPSPLQRAAGFPLQHTSAGSEIIFAQLFLIYLCPAPAGWSMDSAIPLRPTRVPGTRSGLCGCSLSSVCYCGVYRMNHLMSSCSWRPTGYTTAGAVITAWQSVTAMALLCSFSMTYPQRPCG